MRVLRRILLALVLAPLSALRAQTQPPLDIEKLINETRLADARAAIAAYHPKSRADSARVLYWRGRIALDDGATSKAIELLETSVALAPDGAAHYWLAIGYIRATVGRGRFQQAWYARRVRTHLERATALSPRLLDARYYLIQYYLRAPSILGGGKDKALAQADTIMLMDPKGGSIARAQVAETIGDLKLAERDYLSALKSYPDYDIAYLGLGGFYRRQKRYSQAVEVYEKLRRLGPDVGGAQFQIGRTIAEWGQQLVRGEAELDSVLAAPSLAALEAADAHYYLGMIRRKRGDDAGAREEWNRALKLNPALEDALAALKALR